MLDIGYQFLAPLPHSFNKTIELLIGDQASVDLDHVVRKRTKKAEPFGSITLQANTSAVVIGKRRSDDWFDLEVLEFADAPQRVFKAFLLGQQLGLVAHMLPG